MHIVVGQTLIKYVLLVPVVARLVRIILLGIKYKKRKNIDKTSKLNNINIQMLTDYFKIILNPLWHFEAPDKN